MDKKSGVIIAILVIAAIIVLPKLDLFSINHAETFSVVGDDRGCGLPGGIPNDEGTFTGAIAFGTSECAGGYGIVDIFVNNPWSPYMEYSLPHGQINCPSGSCTFQVYCCPKKECTSNSDCDGGTCNQVQCSSWKNGGYQCPTELNIPYFTNSYSYCTSANIITCYYKQNGVCNSRTYSTGTSCSQMGSPAGFYQGMKLYSSSSECNSAQECTNDCSTTTCSGNYILNQCGQYDNDACLDTKTTDCSTTGQTCSNGACVGGVTTTCMESYASKNSIGTTLVGTTCSVNSECKSGFCNSKAEPDRCDISDGANNYLNLDNYNSKDLSSSSLFDIGLTRHFHSSIMPGTINIGGGCDINADCKTGYCKNPGGWWGLAQGDCDIYTTPNDCTIKPTVNITNPTGGDNSYAIALKIPLSYDTISKSTNTQLLASACLQDKECNTANEGNTCEHIASLREKGILSEVATNSLWDKAQTLTLTTASFGASGYIVCGLLTVGTSIAPPLAVGVATSCAVLAGTLGYTTGKLIDSLGTSDILLDKLKAKDANSVGICVAKGEGGTWCSIASKLAFISITGDKCTDGSIIMGIIVLFAMILLTRM